MSNIFSPRKPILSTRQMIKMEEKEDNYDSLDDAITSEDYYFNKETPAQFLIDSLEIRDEFGFDYSEVLSSIKKYSIKNPKDFAKKVYDYGEDFSVAAELTDLLGYERTKALMENRTSLNSFKKLVNTGEITPIKLEKEKGDLNSKNYTVVYLFSKDFLESDKFKGLYGNVENLKKEINVIKNEKVINDILERHTDAKISYNGTVAGFPVVLPKNKKFYANNIKKPDEKIVYN